MSNHLTPTQIKRRAQFAALVKSLKPNSASHFSTPVNLGPMNVRRATGLMGTGK